jgi:aldose 1-epimerase
MPEGTSASSIGRSAAPEAPSGRQWELEGGGYRAVVVEVGGGLRTLYHGEHALLDGYEVDAIADAGRGQLLLPWPNRVADGRYQVGGQELQLDLSEPALGHAIHGLVRWASWTPAEATPLPGDGVAEITLLHRLQAKPSYPFTLDYAIGYRVDTDGLTVTVAVTNVGSGAAPLAAGAHPYLTAGTATIDDCTLHVPADEVLTTDARLIPQGRRPVAGSPLDFRTPRRIGDLVLDTAYTGLVRGGGDGRVRVTLSAPSGRSTELWVDGHHPYLMIFTGDTLAPGRRRQGLAVEPMTAPPNALASGEGLDVLAPGERHTVSWGIRDVTPR